MGGSISQINHLECRVQHVRALVHTNVQESRTPSAGWPLVIPPPQNLLEQNFNEKISHQHRRQSPRYCVQFLQSMGERKKENTDVQTVKLVRVSKAALRNFML
jgi:hypothetical protein